MVFMATILLAGQNPKPRLFGFFCMVLANWFFFLYGVQVVSTALMLGSIVFMVLNCYGILRNLLYIKEKE